MSISLGGLEIPVWKSALTFALAGFTLIGMDVKNDVEVLNDQMSQRREVDAGAMQFRTDVRERLDRIETDIRELRREKPNSSPLPAGESTDLSPLVRQLNNMERASSARDAQQTEDIKRLYEYLRTNRRP